jgi:hypothetical protein
MLEQEIRMARQGFYSLVQFCPDRERAEGVNVGVIVFSAAGCLVRAKFSETNADVARRLWPLSINGRVLADAKISLQRRLERTPLKDLNELETFLAREAGVLSFVPFRSMQVSNPEADVVNLYERLVKPSPQTFPPPIFSRSFSTPESVEAPLQKNVALRSSYTMEQSDILPQLNQPWLSRSVLYPPRAQA